MKKMMAAIGLMASLAGCGGGGGDSGPPPVVVTVSPASGQASGIAGTMVTGMGMDFTATLSTVPDGKVYPTIVSSSSAIRTGIADALQTGANTWTVHVYSVTTLAPGTYSGTVSLQLCKDMQCSGQYPVTGASVPFTFTVIAMPKFTLTAHGATTAVNLNEGGQLSVPNGTRFTLTSDTPMTWTSQAQGASLQQSTTTSTTFSAVVVEDAGISGGMVQLHAAPVAVPDQPFRFDVLPD